VDPAPKPEPVPEPDPTPEPGTPTPNGPEQLSAANTGFRASGLSSSDLKASGSVTTTRAGQVIEGLDITGRLIVKHRDVVIRDLRIRHRGGYGISSSGDVGRVTIRNVEIDGQGVADGLGILLSNVDVRGCHVHGQRVGMQFRSGSSIVGCYIHDQAVAAGTHNTAMSSHGGSGMTVVGNRLESSTSASLSLYPRLAPIRDVDVRGNLFEGRGRGIGLYGGWTSNHPYRDENRDIRIVGNRWTGSFKHGTHLAFNGSQPGSRWSDNSWLNGSRIDG
jgi:hypothetical protein